MQNTTYNKFQIKINQKFPPLRSTLVHPKISDEHYTNHIQLPNERRYSHTSLSNLDQSLAQPTPIAKSCPEFDDLAKIRNSHTSRPTVTDQLKLARNASPFRSKTPMTQRNNNTDFYCLLGHDTSKLKCRNTSKLGINNQKPVIRSTAVSVASSRDTSPVVGNRRMPLGPDNVPVSYNQYNTQAIGYYKKPNTGYTNNFDLSDLEFSRAHF